MVLAAMLKESILRKARKEGFEQGLKIAREARLKKMREEHRKRWDEAYARFGFEVEGVLMLPCTPEVQRFIEGEDEPEKEG